jgi:hypothetical protein
MIPQFFVPTLITSLAGIFLSSQPAYARLGETEAQSQARYGAPDPGLIGANEAPLLEGAKELAYNYQGWRVRAAFIDGVAVRVEYAKIPDAGGLKKLTDAEVQAVLEAEKGAFSWREVKPRLGNAGLNALKTAFDGKTWERNDRAAAKLVFELKLVVETHEAEAIAKRAAKQQGKPAGAGNSGVPKF